MDFEDYVEAKQTKIKKYRKYELRYPENTQIIIDCLKKSLEKEDTHDNINFSYLSIAEYMYYALDKKEVSVEGLRKIVARIATENDLELR